MFSLTTFSAENDLKVALLQVCLR